MERGQQTIRIVSENLSPGDFWEHKLPARTPLNCYDEVIRELDAIFDQMHGGRVARYYMMR